MKNRMRMLVAAFGIVCGIGLAFPVQQVAAEENTDDTTQDSAVIPEHISIGGTDVSGMSLDEASGCAAVCRPVSGCDFHTDRR